MKRIYMLLAGVLILAAVGVPLVSGQRTAHAATFYTVELMQTPLGKVLTTASGYTLYAFSKDTAKKDACAKISGCPSAWPADDVAVKPSAGPGLKSKLLSTISVGRAKQVTYGGHPLYIYSGDSGPRQTSYVGVSEFGGHWDAVNAAGKTVK